MDEQLGVMRRDYLAIGALILEVFSTRLAAAGRDNYSLRLLRRLHRVGNDVLLQNFVSLKCSRTRFEDVQPAQRHGLKEQLPKRSEVWPVAKTARCDGDHLASVREKLHRKRQKSSVEIARLDACGPQQQPRPGVAVNLAIGRVQNRCVERGLMRREQVATHH